MNNDASHPIGMLDMSNTEYHSAPGISSTQVKALSISPLYYWDLYVNPDREPREEKHCFAVGDGTHKLVLEPGTFENTYAVGFDKSAFPDALDTVADLKKACGELGLMISGSKPELAQRLVEEGGVPRERIMLYLEEDHNKTMKGKVPIPANDYKNMIGMLRSIHSDPIAGGLLKGATTEQSFFWRDEHWLIPDKDGVLHPILRKCRTDIITANGEFVLDLKTTDDVSPDGFGRTIARLGYLVSAAWYLDILRGLYGDSAPSGFAFIAVQKQRPHDVAVYYLNENHIRAGRSIYQRNLDRLAECMRTNTWPGVACGEVIEARVPDWYLRQADFIEAESLR